MIKLQILLNRFLPPALVASYILHFALNFASSPLVSLSFILITTLSIIAAVTLDLASLTIVVIAFSFIEGQGRVIFGYNFIFRIAFDLFSLFLIFRVITYNKKILNISQTPKLLLLLFTLHVLWFLLNLFNLSGAAPLYAFAAAKYYILPFMLFFALISIKEFEDLNYIRKIGSYIIPLTILTCSLCIYQLYAGESSLYNISQNYYSLFKKYSKFQGTFFRPWGTSHDAGGMSVYLMLSLGFLVFFFKQSATRFKTFYFSIIISLCWFTLYICQVRSAFIKHTLILAGIFVISLIYSRKLRLRHFFLSAIGMLGLLLTMFFISPEIELKSEDSRLNNATKRYLALFESDFNSKRGSIDHIAKRIAEHTNWPFGHGPGMITNFLPEIDKKRKELITKEGYTPYQLWSGDNFFLFSFLELGIGAFFYLALFLVTPIIILARYFKMNRNDNIEKSQLVLSSVIILMVIILGNWGAVGLSFNPESFYFWLWAAVGWSSSSAASKKTPN